MACPSTRSARRCARRPPATSRGSSRTASGSGSSRANGCHLRAGPRWKTGKRTSPCSASGCGSSTAKRVDCSFDAPLGGRPRRGCVRFVPQSDNRAPAMLELDDLLAPISDHLPAGEDMSFSAEFDAIQEARRADDPTLDQGEWVTDIKYADWNTAAKLCEELLRSRTKDLRVGAWLTEANASLHGFPGLTRGFRVLAGLCERYWEQVHPQDMDAEHEERIGNFGWLLANAVQWIRSVPITPAAQGRYGLGDFEAAHARGGEEPGSDQPGLEELETARRDTPHGFYMQLMAEVPDCRAALLELQAAVDARLGTEG